MYKLLHALKTRAYRPTKGGEKACKPHTACIGGEIIKIEHADPMSHDSPHAQLTSAVE